MRYELLAGLVVVLHLAFIGFAVLGGLLVLRWRRCLLLHLPAVAWAALIELLAWPCPLTPVEKWLRRMGGRPAYEGGFIEHVVVPLIYPPGLTRAHQVALGAAVVVVNVAVYTVVWRRGARGGGGRSDDGAA